MTEEQKTEKKEGTKIQKPTNVGIYVLAGVGVAALLLVVIWPVVSFVNSRMYTQPEFDSYESVDTTLGEENQEDEVEGGEEESLAYTDIDLADFSVTWIDGAYKLTQKEMTDLMLQIDPDYISKVEEGTYTNICDEESYGMDLEDGMCDMHIYQAGTIASPKELAGESIYYIFIPTEGMGIWMWQELVFVDKATNKFVVIEEEVSSHRDAIFTETGWFTGKIAYTFPELSYPETINIPDQASYLVYKTGYWPKGVSMFNRSVAENNMGGITNIPAGKTVNLNGKPQFTDESAGRVSFFDQFYYIELPNGSVQMYELTPHFFDLPAGEEKDMYAMAYDVDIDWGTGYEGNAEDQFRFGGEITREGCGAGISTLDNIANNKSWFNTKNLVEIGKTKNGEPVFELSDKETNTYYKEFFDYGYASYAYFQMSEEERKGGHQSEFSHEDYENFLNDNPIFFWKDYKGNWRYYVKSKYETLAECGKPVIYLYPEEQTDVRVQVEPNGGFTVTDPVYPDGGWVVNAKPNGELYYYADGQNYPYLFWEGRGYDFDIPEEGFVLTKHEVPEQMRALLTKAGLNETEREDFMEFWEEKLMRDEYVFVTFVSQREFERGAPLTITPAPDTVLRVFMYYESLSEYKEVAPLHFRSPERKGFTVIEWGGSLPASEINYDLR